jgi:hypothetical protein
MAKQPLPNCPLCGKPVQKAHASLRDAAGKPIANGPALECFPCGCRALEGTDPQKYSAIQKMIRGMKTHPPHTLN